MLKSVGERVWAFDMEWVPDPLAARLLYGVDDSVQSPAELLEVLWGEGGASEEDPTPFLKLVQCRIVSIAAVERLQRPGGEARVRLVSLPRDASNADECSEAAVIQRFLDGLGEHRPQLVGFNSIHSDLRILVQRGIILGLHAPGFCRRPDKPWQGTDYFARGSDSNLDLKDMLGGWGKGVPSLHELAVQCGVPGKMDVDGNQVARLWLDGELRRIVGYNELDALTTYLVWLRTAHFAGQFSTAEYAVEQRLVREAVEEQIAEGDASHLEAWLKEWDRLGAIIADR